MALVAGLPGNLGSQAQTQLLPLVGAALSQGWTTARLRDHLVARVDIRRVYSPAAVYARHLRDLPAPPRSAAPDDNRAALVDPCPQHPHREAADCRPCASAAPEPVEPMENAQAVARARLGSLLGPAPTRPRRTGPPTWAERDAARETEETHKRQLADQLLSGNWSA